MHFMCPVSSQGLTLVNAACSFDEAVIVHLRGVHHDTNRLSWQIVLARGDLTIFRSCEGFEQFIRRACRQDQVVNVWQPWC